jgi:hypothetical protein
VGFSHRTDADNDRTLASQPRYQGAGPLAEVPRRVRTNQLPRRFSIRKRSPRLITPLVTGSPRARTALRSIEGGSVGISLGEYPSRFVENDIVGPF